MLYLKYIHIYIRKQIREERKENAKKKRKEVLKCYETTGLRVLSTAEELLLKLLANKIRTA